MNFEFSEEVQGMREEARRFLRETLPSGALRARIERGQAFDRDLWREIAGLGWLGVTIPEVYGGSGLGYEVACMLAEEMGAALTPTPHASSIYLACEALLKFGSEDQKTRWLPQLAAGEAVGCFALAEGWGEPAPGAVQTTFAGGVLHGTKAPVADGGAADFAIVAARTGDEVGLYLLDLAAAGIERREIDTLDPARPQVQLTLAGAAAEPLPGAIEWEAVETLLDRAAVLFAFEQVGGAQAALDMAVDYAKNRYAFGRPIGSQQAIKHRLADMYVAAELARSNAYYGAWALDHDAPDLAAAASAARIAASRAFEFNAKEDIQVHGGMGFTWEADVHWLYRRSKQLALVIGSSRYWKARLIDHLTAGNGAEAAA